VSIDQKSFVAAITASAAIFFAAGCQTTASERAANTAESLNTLQAEIKKANDALGVSVTSLDDLVQNPKPDLKPQYDAFSKAMDNLDGQLAVVKKTSETMKTEGKAYFAAWEEESKTMSSPEMQQYSEERRSKLNEHYESIKTEVARISEIGKPLMESLRDTRKVLSMDLTATGVSLAKGPAEKAKASAAELKGEIDKLTANLDAVAKQLAAPAPKK
jgi:DUF2959 family protein